MLTKDKFMKVTVNHDAIVEEISNFEEYIKNKLYSFNNIKDQLERKLARSLFKIRELREFQFKARAYYDLISRCEPESESDKDELIQTYAMVEDVLFWLFDEIKSEQQSLLI
jgi:hypothetical protein